MALKKVGRPPKPEAEKRQQFGVRASAELKARLEAAAAANGRSVAQESELRLVQSFELGNLFGEIQTLRLLAAVAAELARAEAATGQPWHQDVATHAAAAKLASDAIKRAEPNPPNFGPASEACTRFIEITARARSIFDLLTDYRVLGPPNALLAFAERRQFELPPYKVLDETFWRGVNGGEASEEDREALRNLLAEMRSIEDATPGLWAKVKPMMQPLWDARKKGEQIYRSLNDLRLEE